MELILKIAWRNIIRHKGKSIVIGTILFIGALLMTMGNGMVSGMEAGINENIINGFMGDVVIVSQKQKGDSVLLTMMGTKIEPVYNYKAIKEVLKKEDYIDRFLPAGKDFVMALNEEDGEPGYLYMLGVDFEEYQKMFPGSLKPIEGRLLNKDEKGVLVPAFAREEYYNYSNIWVLPEGGKPVEENMTKTAKENKKDLIYKDNLIFLGMNEMNSTMDIRLGIKGVVKFKAINTIFGHFNIVDIESYRECMGYFSADQKAVDVPKEEKVLLDTDNLDSMFGSDDFYRSSDRKSVFSGNKPAQKAVKKDLEDGVYNMVFIKLKNSKDYKKNIAALNKVLTDNNLNARAMHWKKAAGPIGGMATIIKGALFVFVMLLFVVAVVIIINTLTMAALERTSEIGMMRAIGAKKSFIEGMFFGETAILSFFFGGLGVITGVIAINVVSRLNITTTNDILQLLYGGDRLMPIFQAGDLALTIIQLVLVTVAASFYPILVARDITPLDAISRD